MCELRIIWGQQGEVEKRSIRMNHKTGSKRAEPCAPTVGSSLLDRGERFLSPQGPPSAASACMTSQTGVAQSLSLKLGSPHVNWKVAAETCCRMTVSRLYQQAPVQDREMGTAPSRRNSLGPITSNAEQSDPRCLEQSAMPLGNGAHFSRPVSGWFQRRIAPLSYCFANA